MSSVLKNLIESVPEDKTKGIIHFDQNGKVLLVTANLQRFLMKAFKVNVVVGESLQGEVIEDLNKNFSQAFKTGESSLSIQSPIDPHVSADFIFFRTSQEDNSIAVTAFVKESYFLTLSVEEQLKKLSLVALNTPSAVMICDKNGDIEWVNSGFVRLTGYTQDEVFGKDPIDLLFDNQSNQATKEKIQTQLRERKEVKETFLNFNKQGEPYWIQLIANPVTDQEGRLLYYVAVGADVTDKMNYLNEVESRNRFFDSISKSIPAVIYVFNVETSRLDFINDYVFVLTGYTAKEIMRMDQSKQSEIIDRNDYLIFRKSFLKLVARPTPSVENCQLSFTHKSGSRRTVALTQLVFQRNTTGSTTHILGSIIDVTDKYKLDKYRESVKRLNELQERKNQKLRALILLQGQEEERKRIARELHDGIGQLLTATNLKLNSINEKLPGTPTLEETVSEVKALVSKTIKEIRTISYALVPVDLFDFGLEAAIKQLCEYSTQSGLPTTFHSNMDGKRLHSTIEIEFYRIAQEAMNNSVKYAKASAMEVQLFINESRGNIKLILIDNGIGFIPEADYIYKKKKNRSFGLRNMHERSRIINGKLKIISANGEGCVIRLEAPLKLNVL